MLTNIRITGSLMQLFLKGMILLNVLVLAGTFIINYPGIRLCPRCYTLLKQSNLGLENVFASWYSSSLLLLSAIVSFICFTIDRKRFQTGSNSILNYGWLIYALCFALLSFDEMGSIHEYIGDDAAFDKAGSVITGEQKSGWTMFYYLVGFVSVVMFLFSVLRIRLSKSALLFLILGLLCYVSNPFQEIFEIESYQSASNTEQYRRPVQFTLLEEGSEIFGSLFFLIAVAQYALAASRRLHQSTNNFSSNIIVDLDRKFLIRFSWLLIALFAIGLIIIDLRYPGHVGQNQVGVPKNWITSAFALIMSLGTFYVYYIYKKAGYLVLSIICLFISIYYGCDRFAYVLGKAGHLYSAELAFAILSITLLTLVSRNTVLRKGVSATYFTF